MNLYVFPMHLHLCFFTFCFLFPGKKLVNILVGNMIAEFFATRSWSQNVNFARFKKAISLLC